MPKCGCYRVAAGTSAMPALSNHWHTDEWISVNVSTLSSTGKKNFTSFLTDLHIQLGVPMEQIPFQSIAEDPVYLSPYLQKEL